jgi:hypothetical protein
LKTIRCVETIQSAVAASLQPAHSNWPVNPTYSDSRRLYVSPSQCASDQEDHTQPDVNDVIHFTEH